MRAETESTPPPSNSQRDSLADESLTDIIDQLSRRAFLNSLDRRHGTIPYSTVVESARLVPTQSSTQSS